MENSISKESSVRKARSESVLKEKNVPINSHLPYIEDSKAAHIRTTEEVALRAMALLVVAVKAEGLEQDIVNYLITTYDLSKAFSANEKVFIEDLNPSQHDKTQFIWRYEAAWVLLWSLGFVPELDSPTHMCDVGASVEVLQQRTREQFLNDSTLRTASEILDQNDLIYRYHWAVVDARIKGLKTPGGVDSSVVLERHYALNWLVGYMGQEWDDVSTDT